MQFTLKEIVLSWWRYALGVLILLVVFGYFYLGQGRSPGAILAITSGDFIQKVSVSGTVVAAQDVDLGFAANGRIAGTYAKVGQHVSAGTVLAETENNDLVAELAKANANLASLLSGTRPEEIAVAQAALVNAIQTAYTVSDDAVHNKADLLFNTADTLLTNPREDLKVSFNVLDDNLKFTVERNRAAIDTVLARWTLLVSSLTSANALDSARQAQAYITQVATLLANANSLLNKGVPNQTTSAATLASYATTVASARASVDSAAAALDSAQTNLILKQAGATEDTIAAERAVVANSQAALDKTYVRAPFDGVVTRMDAKVGEIVSPSTSLISMQSDGIFQIETFVPEVTIAGVMVGNSATTTLDAYGPAVAFSTRVIAVDPAETVKDGVPAYKTTLSFLSADARIRSGMTANVVISIGTLNNAIVIPSGSVGNKNGVAYVSVLVNDKTVNRTVVTGRSPSLGQVEIISGLSDGDNILLTPSP